jgi:hypothetical protein
MNLDEIALNPNLAPRAHTQRERMVFRSTLCSSSGAQGLGSDPTWDPSRLISTWVYNWAFKYGVLGLK